LAESLREQGLLQPIGILPEGHLVFGERRIRAARKLGWKEIDARIVKPQSILAGELAENDMRKDFTVSERVAIAAALEAEMRRRGERRGRPRKEEKGGERTTFSKEERTTAAIVAKAAGFKGRQAYERARAVVEAAEKWPSPPGFRSRGRGSGARSGVRDGFGYAVTAWARARNRRRNGCDSEPIVSHLMRG